MMTTTTSTNSINPVDALMDHAANVELYREVSLLASAGYPAQLTPEQTDAYQLLPQLIEDCRTAFDLIPLDLRPLHYLVSA